MVNNSIFQIHKQFEPKKTEAPHLHKWVQSHKPEFLFFKLYNNM
jgi:hypothetical protein